MSTFTTPLEFELIGVSLYRLTQPFEYHVGAIGSGIVISVPAGFVTDLATIPNLLWVVFPPDGAYAKAAVIHDFMYQDGRYSRAWADEIFNEAMRVIGVGHITRFVIYSAVRTFGWRYFGKRGA